MMGSENDKKYENVSSSLLVQGAPVGTYKAMGFLFDGSTSAIRHIYGIDSNSSTTTDAQLSVGNEDEFLFSTLKELAHAVRHTNLLNKSSMNEVNADFQLKDLKGLVVLKLPNTTQNAVLGLKVRIVQKTIQQQFGVDLPIYRYDQRNGSLEMMDLSQQAVQQDISTARSDSVVRNIIGFVRAFLANGQ